MYLQTGLLLLVVRVAWTEDHTCNGTVIRGHKYEEEILKDGLDSPFQLNVHYGTNTLYFTVTSHVGEDLGLSTASINLNNGEIEYFPDIIGTATAVDNKNHIVYFSSIDGIHTFDPITKQMNHIGSVDGIIWQMFFKDRLYYTDLSSSTPFVFENGVSKKVEQVDVPNFYVTYIAVDKHDNIWIGNSDGELHCYLKSENRLVPVGRFDVNGFSVDFDGNLHFSTNDGLYSIKEDGNIEQLLEKSNVYGMAFDIEHNIIYSDKTRIVRLKPTQQQCP